MDEITRKLRWLRENKPKDFAKALMQMADKEVESIIFDWSVWARPNQLPPDKDWRIWLVLAGRGLTLGSR